MEITPLRTTGCFSVLLDKKTDQRGYFIKTFQNSVFENAGIALTCTEDFCTLSKKNVIRGMHFQLPPKALRKIVYCISGVILDVLVDLREGSPMYLKTESFMLNAEEPRVIYLPVGIAHGFLTLSDEALVGYKVDQEHDPTLDSGIHWDSFGFTWPVKHPILSHRDSQLPRLSDFNNPFVFDRGMDG